MGKRPDPAALLAAARGERRHENRPPDRPHRGWKLRPVPLAPEFAAARDRGEVEPDVRAFALGPELRCLVGSSAANGWHLSVSHPARTPHYYELAEARDRLLPADRAFALIFPASSDFYVNVHPHCLHLWEIGREEVRDDGRDETPL